MSLAFTSEERLLADSVRDLLAARSPVGSVRGLRDRADSRGYDRDLWRQFAAMGLLDLMNLQDATDDTVFAAGVVARELGRNVVPSPYLATAGAVHCLARSAGDAARDLARDVTAASLLVVLAHDPADPAPVTAIRTADGFQLAGTLRYVPFAAEADVLVVPARLDGATALFTVPTGSVGVTGARLMDTRHRGHVELAGVGLGSDGLLIEGADDVLTEAARRTTVLLAAEMLGSAEAALQLTVGHLRTREQFGALLGTFQALAHRTARMYVELELATSLVFEALRAVDAAAQDAGEAVSAAKAFVADAFLAIAGEGVQLHGGLGMTDEADIGLYLKRARVAAAEWGDAPQHRAAVASTRGL